MHIHIFVICRWRVLFVDLEYVCCLMLSIAAVDVSLQVHGLRRKKACSLVQLTIARV